MTTHSDLHHGEPGVRNQPPRADPAGLQPRAHLLPLLPLHLPDLTLPLPEEHLPVPTVRPGQRLHGGAQVHAVHVLPMEN